ncbi:MAG: helix-turn-helix transcriptional regulator [Oscillospiraceae bacterium]|nr:helix-turn-helix transcriptional regulator [Oscillospiraceae bacterium]DAF15720.1 MAG TPA: helix-turn-helix domain protein [Caudoviricetes sp.]DAJ46818.1 MAG TPA: helix-turn-helix domain protein [Bacteriophage sp.]DAR74371.1 MAG TPA: helix-turn-helix domain protein [Caudoviricetes sp.]
METINDRIAWCVKDSKLTKTAFSEKLNVSQAFISQLCSGAKMPSDRTIADICREFNISELWLRTGEGEPHIQRDEDEEFLEVMEQIHMSDDELIKRIIKAYWFMEDEEKAAIRKLIDGFTKK